MKKTNKKLIFRLAYYSLMLAISIVIGIAENYIVFIPVPGAKIGLANIISVLLLYTTRSIDTLLLTTLRVLIVSLATGKFLTHTFYMSLAGALISVIIMALLKKIRVLVPIIVSGIGAIARVIVEVIVGTIIIGVGIYDYLYIMLPMGFVSGILVGVISYLILKFRKDLKLPNFSKEKVPKIKFYKRIY